MSQSLPRGEGPAYQPLHLSDYWHVLLRRRWLALSAFVLIGTLGVAHVLLTRPVYEATAQILIEQPTSDALEGEKAVRAGTTWQDYYQTQHRLLQSRLLARKVVERLHLLQDPEFAGPRPAAEVQVAESAPPGQSAAMEGAVDTLQSRLEVRPLKNSQLVALTARSFRPDLAPRLANALAEAYIQQTLDFRYRTSAEAGAWLTRETEEQARQLEASEAALQSFKEREGLVNVEERRAILDQKLKDLGGALTAARTRRLEKEALKQNMRAAARPEELPDALRSPLIQTLRTELASLERQGAQLGERYLDQHPQVVRLRQQIEGTRQKIAAEAGRVVRAAESEYQVAAAQEASVAEALEAAKREAEDLSQRAVKYDALKRDLEASQRLSDSLVSRQKQADVVRDIKASSVHVIDSAVAPGGPSRPRPVRDLGLALLLGLGVAVAVAFLRDYLDTSVGRPSDVRLLGLPLLGVIPETRTRGQAPVLARFEGQVPGRFVEGYRVLRTGLRQAAEAPEGQVLLVTSTLPGEGKTITSANLALSLASTEERVLLVDADLRRPALSQLLHTRKGPGLCEVLAGRAEPDAAIQRIPGSRLSVLPCGTPPPRGPADLMSTSAMRELLVRLRSRFDCIVLDAPPVGPLADALVLASLVDGVLLVARCGKVTRSALVQVLECLANARARVLGVVLNRARPDRHHYDYGPAFGPPLALQEPSGRLPS